MQELTYFVFKSTGRVQKWNKWAMKNDDQPIRDMEKWCHDDDDLIYEHIYTTLWSQHTCALPRVEGKCASSSESSTRFHLQLVGNSSKGNKECKIHVSHVDTATTKLNRTGSNNKNLKRMLKTWKTRWKFCLCNYDIRQHRQKLKHIAMPGSTAFFAKNVEQSRHKQRQV